MKKTNTRKLIAGASAIAMATGMAATLGMGASNAASVSSDKIAGNAMSFTRTVSGDALVDGKITVGEEITITNTIERKLSWLLYWAQDNHPACLVPVENTSVWTVSNKIYSNSGNADDGTIQKASEVTSGEGWVKIDATGGNSWNASPLIWAQNYTVTCNPGSLNTGGLQWDSTLLGGSENKADVGPTITVKAKPTNPGDGNGSGNGDGETATGSLGSLGSVFGSLG